MAIKVFCRQPEFSGYQTNPADTFLVTVAYVIHEDTGGENDGPRFLEDAAYLSMALGSSPGDVYADVYAAILASCSGNGYSTPAKADIFAFIPHSMSVLLPD